MACIGEWYVLVSSYIVQVLLSHMGKYIRGTYSLLLSVRLHEIC